MIEGTMTRRHTGLSRAKRIEQLSLWLGLPLLLLLLALASGLVGYTPVRQRAMPVQSAPAAPAIDAVPTRPSISIRPDRLMPLPDPESAGDSILLEETTPLS